MQYVLSEDEWNQVQQQRREAALMPSMEALTNVCRLIATRAVGPIRPNSSHVMERAHGCIHVQPRDVDYCDFCPVAGICPLPKNWSK